MLPEAVMTDSPLSEPRQTSEYFSEMTSFSHVLGKDNVNRAGCCGRGFGTLLRAAVHLAALAALAVGDIMRFHHSKGESASGVALACLYASTAIVLWSMCLLERFRSRGRGLRPPWLTLSTLHTAIVLVAARWRAGLLNRSVKFEDGASGFISLWAAVELAALQLLLALLYPQAAEGAALWLSNVAVFSAFLLAEFSRTDNVADLVEGGLFIFAAAAATTFGLAHHGSSWSGLVSSWRRSVCEGVFGSWTDDDRLQVRRMLRFVLDPDAESDELQLQGDHRAEMFQRLALTQREVSQNHLLDPVCREALNRFLLVLLRDLQQPWLPQELLSQELAEAPPMTKEFVNWELIADQSAGFERGLSTASTIMLQPKKPVRREARAMTKVHLTFAQTLNEMMSPFNFVYEQDSSEPSSSGVASCLQRNLGKWTFDILTFSQTCDHRTLATVGGVAMRTSAEALGIDQTAVDTFLGSIEARYRENLYHNAVHAADVLNSMYYFLTLKGSHMLHLEPIEKLAALAAASAHDVGHDGKANRYHTAAQTSLARLYNDQSPLENMHCALMFTVLRTEGSNFLKVLDPIQKATFRGLVIPMILETDLAKHFQAVSHFRQEFLPDARDKHSPPSQPLAPAQHRELLSFVLKACDVGGSTKPFSLHAQWAARILGEFFLQGDAEKEVGLPCSPFCDRHATSVAESQQGFFNFIVLPLYAALGDFLKSKRLRMEVTEQMNINLEFWKAFDDKTFNVEEPLKSVGSLQLAHRQFLQKLSPGSRKAYRHNTTQDFLEEESFDEGSDRIEASWSLPKVM